MTEKCLLVKEDVSIVIIALPVALIGLLGTKSYEMET